MLDFVPFMLHIVRGKNLFFLTKRNQICQFLPRTKKFSEIKYNFTVSMNQKSPKKYIQSKTQRNVHSDRDISCQILLYYIVFNITNNRSLYKHSSQY